MRQLILYICFVSLAFACTKSQKEKGPDVTCIVNSSWLTRKMAELSNCTCLTAIYQGTYIGQSIIEIRGIDPLCNGINIVHKSDGAMLLNSGDQSLYQAYLSSVQNLQLIWSCTKSKWSSYKMIASLKACCWWADSRKNKYHDIAMINEAACDPLTLYLISSNTTRQLYIRLRWEPL